ncbi:MAG: TetR/AcrR family transcriptional regulator [Vallitalea sp.]|jgi:AcrR family transcriptional regulator|nr:TetR/AcrR family transcriptional regulator [Vallitalea sp.]
MSKKGMIYEAATSIMVREGIDGLTISKVAYEANIGKSTVYEYFASKDELIYETINYMAEKYVEDFKEKLFKHDGGFEIKVKLLIKMLIATMKKGNGNFMFIVSECDKTFKAKIEIHKRIQDIMLGIRMKFNDVIEDIIQLGVNEGIIEKPVNKINFIVWQNLIVMLSYEYSGVDAFLERYNIDISDEEKNINTIYKYLLKIL